VSDGTAARARHHPDLQRAGQPAAPRAAGPRPGPAPRRPHHRRRLARRHRRQVADELAARIPASTSCTGPASSASAPPTSPASAGARARLRLALRDGRRLLPRPRAPAAVHRRARRPTTSCSARATSRARHRRQLAHGPAAALLVRQRLRPLSPAASLGRDRRLQGVPPRGARGHRPRPRRVRGYSFQIEMSLRAWKRGFRIGRSPSSSWTAPRRIQDVEAHRPGGRLARLEAPLRPRTRRERRVPPEALSWWFMAG
jgi:hypothetical protein